MKCFFIILLLRLTCAQGQLMNPPSTPTITMVTSQATSINLAWSQRAGDVVDSYTISYSYVTRGCEGSVLGGDTLTEMDGSSRTYTLSDVQEDSDFDISITAVNEAGSSVVPARTSATTLVAAPSGIVASLMATAATSTTVTFTWGRVICRDRNVEITRYAIQYGPSSDPSDITGVFILDIKTNNVYTITGLIPRTNYTIYIRADHSTFSNTLVGTMIATVDAETAVPTALGFLLKGTTYLNNSAVALTAIGAGNNALICLTNLTECCRSSDTGGMGSLGLWKLPDGSPVPGDAPGSTVSITRTRGPSAVLLHRMGSAIGPTGVFTCVVPDASGEGRSVYIYIYAGQVPGSLSITDFAYDRLALVLTCTSSGRPIDTVTWIKDGSDIRLDSSQFSQTQNISDRVTATYQHLLSSGSAANFVGRFTCVVRDGSSGTASRTLALNGVTITHDPLPFTVGENTVLTCSSDTGVAGHMQWVSRDDVVLASGTSVQQLQLVLMPVNDSLSVHTSSFTCSVTRDEGMLNETTSNQTLPVTVTIPSPAISVTISRSGGLVAGSEYNLTCVVSELIDGLTGMPSAAWEMTAGNQIPSEAVQESSRSDGMAMAALKFNPLKTSFGGVYVCRGTLLSPAQQAPLEETAREDVTVQISAPTVSLSVLSGFFVASGKGDVTLTCSASLDVNLVDIGDLEFSFSWRDRDNQIISAGGRISTSSSSNSSSSMLTLSPLNVTHTTITCTVIVAERQGRLVPSAPGNISIAAKSPDPPDVVITSLGPSTTAGTTHSLICNVILVQDLRVKPVIEWMRSNGTKIMNGTVEDVSVFSSFSSTMLTLTFAPLHTSHGGKYWCTASLMDSAVNLSISTNSSYNLTLQIPPPSITITGSPLDDGFHLGLLLTLNGRAEFNIAVDTPLNVETSWSKTNPPSNLSNTNIVTAVQVMESPILYESYLTVNLLDIDRDSGDYSFTFSVASGPFTTGTTITATRPINVISFPHQIIIISSVEAVPTAGDEYHLDCNISRAETLPHSTLLEVVWLDNSNNTIISDSNTSIAGDFSSIYSNIYSQLIFAYIRTSQGGRYLCVANMTVPGVVTDHRVTMTRTVTVIISPATSVTFRTNRKAPHYWGTTLTLTCTVEYDSEIVDTGVVFNISITTDPSNIRVHTNMQTNVGTALFSPLLQSHNGNVYQCLSSILPESHIQFVNSVPNSPSDPITFNLTALPPPSMSVVSEVMMVAGSSLSLTCNVTVVGFLVVVPSVEWLGHDGSPISSVGNPSVTAKPVVSGTLSTRIVKFSSLLTSHGGLYSCLSSLTIPNITELYTMLGTSVTVQILPPSVMAVVIDEPSVSGTLVQLQGTIMVDDVVDSIVTFNEEWIRQDMKNLSEFTSISITNDQESPYTNTLTFNPLRNDTVDGGVYVYQVAVFSNDSLFIEPAFANSSVMLLVKQYPPLNISLTVRTGVCMIEDGATLSSSVYLLPNTDPNHYLNYTWIDPLDQDILTSSDDILVNEGNLVIKNLVKNMGLYKLSICLSALDSGIKDHCNIAGYNIIASEPGMVNNLECLPVPSANGLTLSIIWKLPSVNSDSVIVYLVTVEEYKQLLGTRSVSTSELSPPFIQLVDVKGNLVSIVPAEGIYEFVPYLVAVMTINVAGCGLKAQIDCFSKEGLPIISPQKVKATRAENDNTVLLVSWQTLTIVEARSFILYVVMVRPITARKRQLADLMKEVAMNESSVEFEGIDPYVGYDVTVGTITINSRQSGPVSVFLRVQPIPVSKHKVIVAVTIFVGALILITLALVLLFYLYKQCKKRKIFFSRNLRSRTDSNINSSSIPITPSEASPPSSDQVLDNDEQANIIGETSSNVPVEVMDYMKPVLLESFREHVNVKHIQRDEGFKAEYQSLGSKPVSNHVIANLQHNRIKNRFTNVLPYDFSRVTLEHIAGEEGSDYINACTIDGYSRPASYIAAQGPLLNTESDFWRMIWELQLPNIVMLTKCMEAGRIVCEKYWRDGIADVHTTPDKLFTITTSSVQPFADFIIRTFTVKHRDKCDEELKVTHYHFISWPDHGVPKFSTSLISFIRRVQRGHNKDLGKPLLVHCSAGVGRTGTFITLDAMLDRIRTEQSVNIYEFVKKMRERRVLMVQTMVQYIFIHNAFSELITCGDTEIKANRLRENVHHLAKLIPGKSLTGFSLQFQLLGKVSWHYEDEEERNNATEHYNRMKNRYPDKLPYNWTRACLTPTGEDGSDYINASLIDGYKQRNAYIATQGPLPNTVNDLWRLLMEFKSKVIVTLCRIAEEGKEVCHQFWPSQEKETVKFGGISVTLLATTDYKHFNMRKLQAQDGKNECVVVTQFHHFNWLQHSCPPTGTFIEMMGLIMEMQVETENTPITVVCNDGVGRTGTFICINSQLERLKTEGVVDLFQTIKLIRTQRAKLVLETGQYAFAHQVLADYMKIT